MSRWISSWLFLVTWFQKDNVVSCAKNPGNCSKRGKTQQTYSWTSCRMLKMWLPVSWYKEVIETSDSASCAFRRGNCRVKSSNPFSQVHVLAWGVNSRKLIWLTAADIVFGRNIIRAAPISDEITAAPPPSDLFQQDLRGLGRFKNTLVSASSTAAPPQKKISVLNQNIWRWTKWTTQIGSCTSSTRPGQKGRMAIRLLVNHVLTHVFMSLFVFYQCFYHNMSSIPAGFHCPSGCAAP